MLALTRKKGESLVINNNIEVTILEIRGDQIKLGISAPYMILSEVEDFEEIRDWAALHHEKLDGSGYPFGRTAEELNEPERILACVDIYQALTEDRPYKKGMTHEQACGILEDMAQKGWIDAKITGQVRECFGEIH